MNNAVFGKTMENVKEKVDIKCAFDEDYFLKYTTKPNSKRASKSGDDVNYFMVMEMEKKTVKLNKPIYAGFSILDFSKLHTLEKSKILKSAYEV